MQRPGLSSCLNSRAETILREIVEQYLETGDPVGSGTLSQRLSRSLSSATIRNVMAELTRAGFLFSPHTSAGRLPTDKGLRLFVDGLLQFGALSEEEQSAITHTLESRGRSLQETLTEASTLLSGLSSAVGMVFAPSGNDGLVRHIEFVPLGSGRALVVLVGMDGQVENRVIDIPPGLPASALVEAGNYLNARLGDTTLESLRARVCAEMQQNRSELDALTAEVVATGLATWEKAGDGRGGTLFLRGQGRLLDDIKELERLSTIQMLFDRLETQETMIKLLELARDSEGVRIYIGAESGFFGVAGMSMIVAPTRNDGQKIVGAIGVIGPTRLNYGRIVPVVDYTARVLGRILG